MSRVLFPSATETEQRKIEHLIVCSEEEVEAKVLTTGFEDVFLVHRAIPEIDMDEIDTSVELFGRTLSAPFIITAITGGAPETAPLNEKLAIAATSTGTGIGVGSQRAAIEDPTLEDTYRIIRDNAPEGLVIANLGAPQFSKGYGTIEAEKAIEMVEADCLAIHLNALQEAIQPEGDTNYSGVLDRLKELSNNLKTPIIAKETGAGICAEDARRLEQVGVAGIDVSGVGGTSWAGVEAIRAKNRKQFDREQMGILFWDWGIPTAATTFEVAITIQGVVLSSGGIRTGLDVAKALALGANAAGAALPFLKVADSPVKIEERIKEYINGLKIAMFLTGCRTIQDLQEQSKVVITGNTREWLQIRGFDLTPYSHGCRDTNTIPTL
ncbi:MAG: type 2 isopentenyl-diphosphate Delta-isomerase [Candidatus Heimdallarchaeota archaeon]